MILPVGASAQGDPDQAQRDCSLGYCYMQERPSAAGSPGLSSLPHRAPP